MGDPDEETRQKMAAARNTAGVPLAEPMVPDRSIADLLFRQAEANEEKPFLISYTDDGHRREYSYRDFCEEACRTAHLLRAHGIRRGDRVAVMSPNNADVVVQYFGIWLAGAVATPVNAGEDDRRIAYTLEHSGARLAFVRDQYIERFLALRSHAPSLATVVQSGTRVRDNLPHFQSEAARLPTQMKDPATPALHDDALLVYTSGTTGNPKGVLLDQYNLLVDAMAIAEWHRLSDDQRMMCVLPLHHVNGIVVTLVTPLSAGAGVVVNERFQSDRFFERISTEKVTVVSVVPTLLQFLLHARLSMESYKLAHFRHLICGAGPLTVELAMKFEQKFNIPIVHGYGLSETTCYSCFLPSDLSSQQRRVWLSRHGFPSIGVPLPVNDMTIHDGAGNELGENERGEIVIRGHNVMKEYFRAPAENAETFAHGWFRSGDEGFYRYDEEGRKFFFITGRIKELIIRGGANISPFEIDEVLLKMPGVIAAVAVGFENEWYGEEVGAYVVSGKDSLLTEEGVLEYCRRHLPFAKAPKVVVFGEDIPVTSTGKYQRSKLKELFARWKTVQFSEPK